MEPYETALARVMRESVLPQLLDDGTETFASSISGGADFELGMPRQLRLVRRAPDGTEIRAKYLLDLSSVELAG